MKKLAIVVSAGFMTLACTIPAFAQSNTGSGSIKVDKNALPKADFPKARREVQILDESPIVKDLRPPIEQPATLQINIPPRQVVQGAQYEYGDPSKGGGSNVIHLSPQPNTLPNASWQSNVPAHQQGRNLPNGSSIPLVNTNSSPATKESKAVNATMQTKPVTAQKVLGYPSTAGGASTSGVKVTTNTSAKLTSPLIHHLDK